MINIPDTVGYTTPEEYTRLLRAPLRAGARRCATCELSVHCHDDLGLAVANSYAGRARRRPPGRVRGQRDRRARRQLLAGGDRDAAADAPRRARPRHRPRHPRAGAHEPAWSRASPATRCSRTRRSSGRNAFAHESGIHQDGVLKERTTYEIMDATERRARVELDRARQALGPPRAARRARAARLQGRGQRAQPGVQALQGDRRQEEAGDRARPRGDRLRRDARARRGATTSPGSRSRPARAASRRRTVAVRMPSGEESVGEADRRRPGRRDLRRDPRRRPEPSASCASTRSRRSPRARTRSAR